MKTATETWTTHVLQLEGDSDLAAGFAPSPLQLRRRRGADVTAPQRVIPRIIATPESSEVDSPALERTAVGYVARDEEQGIAARIDDLWTWIGLDNDSAAAFILDELERDDLPGHWRNMVVFAAEDVRFSSEAQDRAYQRLR